MKKIFLFLILIFLVQCSKGSIRADLPINYILIHQHILIDSLEREYVIFKPKEIKLNIILIGLHGRGGTGEELMRQTKFNLLAEREGFIIAYPSGLNQSWVDGRGLPEEDKAANDEKFLLTLKEKLAQEFAVKNFFLFGYSNGGFMTQKMAFTYPESFIGYASVVSTISEGLSKRKPILPVSLLFINGTEDPIIPYKGGLIRGNKGFAVGAEDTVKHWVKWNKCGVKPTVEIINQYEDGVKVFIHTYSNCKNGKTVRFLKLEGAGHGWPGNLGAENESFGRLTNEINANEEIWKFFKPLERKN